MTAIQLLTEASAAPDLRWVFGATILSGGLFLVTLAIGLSADMFGQPKWGKVFIITGIIGLVATILTPIVLALLFVPQGS